jgi:mRNA interferase MazF
VIAPHRGEVWTVALDPTKGHEQAGTRPCLIVSVDKFNLGPAGLVVVLPISSRDKRIPSHVLVRRGEADLEEDGFIKCEEARCVSKERLTDLWGRVESATMQAVERWVRVIPGL